MCGFAGFFEPGASIGADLALDIAERMANAIEHRGPDDLGVLQEAEGTFGVGFRRLSIIDLSPAGHQPMQSSSGRFAMAYNGEIYNAEELRKPLEERGIRFRGHSDTEVLLESFDAYGIERTINSLIGMFAICLWDKQKRKLYLIRDRLGIKPLYWSMQNKRLLFGSQLKCFFGHPGFEPKIDADAMQSYFRFGYVPAPLAIYEDCQKLEPGSWLEIDRYMEPSFHRYWDLREIASTSMDSPINISESEAVQRLNDLLDDAVRVRMVADVPLGAWLSGGIDSSTVVSLMRGHTDRPVQTFSIGFEEDAFDEAPYARAVADHLGTEHHELYVSADRALGLVPDLAGSFDEPFADNSAIPTLLLSEMTQERVTVALSGDGGDELFAGYKRYWETADLFARRDRLPGLLRKPMAASLRGSAPLLDRIEGLSSTLQARYRPAYRARKLADLLSREPAWMMRHIVGHWQSPSSLASHGREPIDPVWNMADSGRSESLVQDLQLADMLTYLPDDILAKTDRASMAVGLEARVPLLDHRVVEFAWSLPPTLRSKQKPAKKLLRSVLERHVPASMIDRPKKGFSVPIHEWLRGPLREWADELLDPQRLEDGGMVDAKMVRNAWDQHQSAAADWRFPLWNVLMFEAWNHQWMKRPKAAVPSGEAGRFSTHHPTMPA